MTRNISDPNIQKRSRTINSNPNTTNPGAPPAPRMPNLPPPPKEPEIKNCIPRVEDISKDLVKGAGAAVILATVGAATGGPVGAIVGAAVGELIFSSSINSAIETYACNKKAKGQYQKDLGQYNQAKDLAKENFQKKSVEYIQYKRKYDAQRARDINAKDEAHRGRKTDRSKTIHIRPYQRNNGTYVNGHYRSTPRKTLDFEHDRT